MGSTATTDRLDHWRDLIREHFVALDIDADRDAAFAGAVRSASLGHLKVATVESVTAEYRRTPLLARRDDLTYLQVGLVARGAAVLNQDGREAVLAPGDFTVYETGRPFRWALRGDWRLLVFTWPRLSVGLDPGESRRLTARTLDGGSGVGGIVGRMLGDLVAAPPALTASGAARLADEVAELVTTVATEHAEDGCPDPPGDGEIRRFEAYIAEHLADPDLGPATVAAAHFISTRHLHRLFTRRGDTVARYIRRRRLERCRRDLADPRNTSTVAEIARRWGFTDPATFSRAFRSTYRAPPGAYRREVRMP